MKYVHALAASLVLALAAPVSAQCYSTAYGTSFSGVSVAAPQITTQTIQVPVQVSVVAQPVAIQTMAVPACVAQPVALQQTYAVPSCGVGVGFVNPGYGMSFGFNQGFVNRGFVNHGFVGGGFNAFGAVGAVGAGAVALSAADRRGTAVQAVGPNVFVNRGLLGRINSVTTQRVGLLGRLGL